MKTIRIIRKVLVETITRMTPKKQKEIPAFMVLYVGAFMMTLVFLFNWIKYSYSRFYFQVMISLWIIVIIGNFCEVCFDIFVDKEDKML